MNSTVEHGQTPTSGLHLETSKVKFSKILVATDFSAQSHTALRVACSLAHQLGSSLVLVHLVPPIVYGAGMDAVTVDMLDSNVDRGRALMEDEIGGCAALHDIQHVEIVETAPLMDSIDEIVTKEKINLIVCGSHGPQGLEKLVIGSTAEAILRHATCPVLIVGPKCVWDAVPFKSILFAADLTRDSFRPAQYAAVLADKGNARLTLLHIATPSLTQGHNEQIDQDATSRLLELVPQDAEGRCQIKTQVVFGDPSKKISATARQEGADLIVMGVRERGALANHAPWGTLTKTIQNAPCPVLAVRGHFGKTT